MVNAAAAKQSLSLRKLSALSGISASSISRIISGKQAANMHHLQQFSKYLDVPMEQLLRAVGVEVGSNISPNSEFIIKIIQDILQSYGIELDDVIVDMQKELKKYEQYAKTEAGKELIHSGFHSKIKELNGEGIIIEQLKRLYELFCSADIDPCIHPIIGSALLYLILTPDVIPDYVFPIGYLDDAIAVSLTVSRLLNEFHITL
ncbi:YkvA family protein [Lacrimispora sphenoides]|uniref:YkvA family protein n=1 Tax=Lacrimispora sphenoides TaxID=29370 RepID=UPI00241CD476|nr:YkvA family protein [Lacrimispora sphenoides]